MATKTKTPIPNSNTDLKSGKKGCKLKQKGQIDVTVRDKNGGDLTEPMKITISGPEGGTQAVDLNTGTVSFPNLEPGKYTVTISFTKKDKSMYEATKPGETQKVTVKGGKTALAPFIVVLTGWIEFSAVDDADGTPIANVTLKIRSRGKEQLVTTDAKGRVRLDALPGDDWEILSVETAAGGAYEMTKFESQ